MKAKSLIFRKSTYVNKICNHCGELIGGPHVQSGGRNYHCECMQDIMTTDIQDTQGSLARLRAFMQEETCVA